MSTLTDHLQASVAATRGLFAAAACSCALATEDGGSLEFVAADGAGAGAIVGVRLPVARGIAGFVALSGQPMAIADVSRDDRFARDVAEATDYVPITILAAPLLDPDGETLGVLEVLDPVRPDGGARLGTQGGTAAELAALTVVASQVAVVVRLLQAAGGPAPAEAALVRDVLAAVASYRSGSR
jgi:signal transduction protein with GAF and PtsI domain